MVPEYKYWFNSYFRGKMIVTDPYPAEKGKESPKYSTIHGPYESFVEALEARREFIQSSVDDRCE